MTNHHGGKWPYHESRNGDMVACASNPCRIHGGSDIMADSPEESGRMMEHVLSAADYWSLPSSSVIPYHIDLPDESIAVMNSIEHGDVLVVGGGVRDSIMGKSNKDIDLEVHGEDLDDIMHELRNHGIHVDSVGRTFGVLTARNHDWSIGVDIATPRMEKKTGTGHTGFDTEQDPYMGVSEAAARRDFTCNAIMDMNVRNGTDMMLRKRVANLHHIATYSDEPCEYMSTSIRNTRRELQKIATAWLINNHTGYDARRIRRIMQRQWSYAAHEASWLRQRGQDSSHS